MRSGQKMIPGVYLALTGMLLVMEARAMDGVVLTYSRFAVMLSLCAVVFWGRRKSGEQNILSMTFLLMLIGDVFLVLSDSLHWLPDELNCLGFLPFALAYALMVRVYLKGVRWRNQLLIPALIYGALLAFLVMALNPYVSGLQRPMGLAAAFSVTIMAWSGWAACLSGHYNKRTTLRMAASGMLMLLCDYGVALAQFHPAAGAMHAQLPFNIVWMAYVPGWLLLALIVIDDDIYRSG